MKQKMPSVWKLWSVGLTIMVFLVACNSSPQEGQSVNENPAVDELSENDQGQNGSQQSDQPDQDSQVEPSPPATEEPVQTPSATVIEEVTEPTAEPPTAEPPPATELPATAAPQADEDPSGADLLPEPLRIATSGWQTDWEQHTIPFEELLPGGPPRDGIPPLDDPSFVSFEEASGTIAAIEPVIALEINGDARAYPLQILTWHEIVNDTVGEVPVVVTFCPLCNSAIVFDRRVEGQTFTFGTSGLLRHSDLVMYDRTTESLWQQLTGEGIVGEMAGKRLEFLPSSLISYQDFQDAYPEGVVLSTNTGFDRPYGVNPYTGYDNYEHPLSEGGEIALLSIEQDNRLEAAERVVAVSLPEESIDVAYPLTILSEMGAINDQQGSQDIAVLFLSGTTSALGSQMIVFAEDVGATGVFDPNLNGQKLTFRGDGDSITDNETGSEWNILGQAIAGPLQGQSLQPIIHGNHFWFSWAAFKPQTIIYKG